MPDRLDLVLGLDILMSSNIDMTLNNPRASL